MSDNGKSLKSIGSVISSNLPPAFRLAFMIAEVERRWADVVGDRLARLSQPVSVDRNGLVVVCETPAAAQMLKMGSATYLRRIAAIAAVDLPGIRAVVSRTAKKRRPRTVAAAKRLYVPKKKIDEALADISPRIKDAGLALSLAKMRAAAEARYGKGGARHSAKPQQGAAEKSDIQK